MKKLLIFCTFCLIIGCAKQPIQSMKNPEPISATTSLTYLALGDSYTIGESVPQSESFPFQLATKLNEANVNVGIPRIIAKTGWTTGELQTAIKLENGLWAKYDIVTLLIGVNNQYRGNSIVTYRNEFKALLQTAISFAGDDKTHVYVISIPDWGVTPFGKASGRNQTEIAKEIDDFNAVNKEETLALGISYTDITSISRNATSDGALIAVDGLHPSGKMYAQWTAALTPKVLANLK